MPPDANANTTAVVVCVVDSSLQLRAELPRVHDYIMALLSRLQEYYQLPLVRSI